MKRTILIILAIKNQPTQNRFQELLAQIVPSLNAKQQHWPLEVENIEKITGEAEELLATIKSILARRQPGLIVLIADWLSDPTTFTPSFVGANRLAKLYANAIVTIAVTPRPRRIADIDRVVGPNCEASVLEHALDLVTCRLEYITAPEKRMALDSSLLSVRGLKSTNETEFRKYFSLRQRIYTAMGYLDEQVEDCRSQLEINEADMHAIHIGAFYRTGTQDILVGTARVVTNTEADEGLREMFEAMIGRDVVVRRRLCTPYGLGLPIFQSHHGMNTIMRETLRNDQICGELSRVTVVREFRGNGISRKLVEAALQKTICKGARRIFLECLEIHEPLYQKHGFTRIQGVIGPVVDVGRTMIAMELERRLIEQARSTVSPTRSDLITNTSTWSRPSQSAG